MNDLISRQAALDIVFDFAEAPHNMYQKIRELPSEEAMRCKDCKYKGWSFVKGEMKLVCDNENGLFRDVQMNDFCSAWERSEE